MVFSLYHILLQMRFLLIAVVVKHQMNKTIQNIQLYNYIHLEIYTNCVLFYPSNFNKNALIQINYLCHVVYTLNKNKVVIGMLLNKTNIICQKKQLTFDQLKHLVKVSLSTERISTLVFSTTTKINISK